MRTLLISLFCILSMSLNAQTADKRFADLSNRYVKMAIEAEANGDMQQAISYYEKAIADGAICFAAERLGEFYLGSYGTKPDYKKGAYYVKMAAESGDAAAQYTYATLLHQGLGVSQNDSEAFKWYTKSALQGESEAQYCLGLAYYYGEGVVEDHAKAVEWWLKAAKQNHPHAQNNLGQCYMKGDGISKNTAEGIKWTREAANNGNADAQCALGSYYEYGAPGIQINKNQAIYWYRKAADQGSTYAQIHLAQFGVE